ncbi:carboxypeptidase-like regulatory domain-containing protein [Bacteroidota bacterium]
MRKLLIIFVIFIPSILFAQEAEVVGRITSQDGSPIEFTNISLSGSPGGATSDSRGYYSLKVPANKQITIVFSFIGYKSQQYNLFLKSGATKEIMITLERSATELNNVTIIDKQISGTNLVRLNPKLAQIIPSMSGGIEEMIKTLPGVTSRNELSSQYSVRGGNFDENLVYVNGIEIYRPFLIREGRQEGLSFINSSLVSSILFSAGGFEAKYGDRMSSVLDIKYKRPTSFAGSVNLSMLGAGAHVEGASKNKKFGYLVGARYKTNQYILKGLQTDGDYQPQFGDVQSLFIYNINKKWDISLLTNYSLNSYKLIPSIRETNFGTITDAYQLRIYFEGQEIDRFETFMGGLSTNYNPNPETNIQFIASTFRTSEEETYDILGQYFIGKLETSLGSEQYGDVVEILGVGTYLDHARNYLFANVYNFEHKGRKKINNKNLQWGARYQREIISDQINEWELVDSAGYSLPTVPFNVGDSFPSRPDLELYYALNTDDINLATNRYSGFVQNTFINYWKNTRISSNIGIRFSYWDLNKQFLASPRLNFAFDPDWKRDIIFRISAGYYYQPPFYKELRGLDGQINTNVKAQKSIHFVGGMDINFMAWKRPFKFVVEAYYKILDDLIPYEIDNVRIRYFAENNAHGYAYGLDMKINGEFIKGVESWASVSLLKTEEDIEGDGLGFIPRPTDQRFNFAMFFQDYLPINPTYSMYIKLMYGSGLPYGPPDNNRSNDMRRTNSYQRVDLGLSKQLISKKTYFKAKNPLKYLKTMWVSLEVLNLFGRRNTISHLWVTDVKGRQIPVPNKLTGRQLNLKLNITF